MKKLLDILALIEIGGGQKLLQSAQFLAIELLEDPNELTIFQFFC